MDWHSHLGLYTARVDTSNRDKARVSRDRAKSFNFKVSGDKITGWESFSTMLFSPYEVLLLLITPGELLAYGLWRLPDR